MTKKKKNQSIKKKSMQNEEKQSVKKVEVVETVEAIEKEETVDIKEEKTIEKDSVDKAITDKENVKEESSKEKVVASQDKLAYLMEHIKNPSPGSIRRVGLAAVKVALPVLALIIVVATIVSLVKTKNEKQEEAAVAMTEAATEAATVVDPLEVDAYPTVNSMMSSYYTALAAGDMDTVKSHMDYISDTDLLQLKNKNDFVESYNNISCYTRTGVEENSYFVYVTYQAKFSGYDTLVPGVTTHYVYTTEDGSLKIANELSEEVNAALMVTSCQDDVVDIFNKVDVEYKEILAADEALNAYLTEMFTQAKTMTGEEIAKLEVGEEETTQAAETTGAEEEVAAVTETTEVVVAEQPQTQVVNEEVKTTATVNVRSSDSENADKIGRAEAGTVLQRVENKINGWSKVIFEGKEAYIKSDYLEVVSSNPVEEQLEAPAEQTTETTNTTTVAKTEGTVTATTNVNVRNKPSTDSETIGTAKGGSEYKLIENQGEWLKIEYKGQTGFVKAEYFN